MDATNEVASAVKPEVVCFQDHGDHEAQVEIIPQAFEIVQINPNQVQQSYVLSNQAPQPSFLLSNQLQQSFVITDQDSDFIYYTFEPGANMEFTWKLKLNWIEIFFFTLLFFTYCKTLRKHEIVKNI